jgi:hypothetical protein
MSYKKNQEKVEGLRTVNRVKALAK